VHLEPLEEVADAVEPVVVVREVGELAVEVVEDEVVGDEALVRPGKPLATSSPTRRITSRFGCSTPPEPCARAINDPHTTLSHHRTRDARTCLIVSTARPGRIPADR